jgi:hypothetical protein
LKTPEKRFGWLCAIALGVCAIHVPAQAQTRKDRAVIVISLDGFPAYALDDPRLPYQRCASWREKELARIPCGR